MNEFCREVLKTHQNQPQMHLSPVQAGIIAGMSKEFSLLSTQDSRTEKMAMLSIVVSLMSSTFAIPSAQPEAAAGSTAKTFSPAW